MNTRNRARDFAIPITGRRRRRRRRRRTRRRRRRRREKRERINDFSGQDTTNNCNL
jgi:hypothetical protein